jgi:two-component system, NarL family, nitrate/nitrite response regulator NarL
VRLVVVEDHVLFAESLSVALRIEGHDVRRPAVQPRTTAPDVVAAVLREQPEVAILDLDLGPSLSGADLVAPLTATGVDVLIVTGSRDRTAWGRCLHEGAGAVVSKHQPLVEILAAVRRLGTGRPGMAPRRRAELIAAWRDDEQLGGAARARFARLTPRERAVLAGLAQGRRIHDIAADDVVSEATVRTQVKAILSKLGVRSQLDAVLMLHRHQPDRR